MSEDEPKLRWKTLPLSDALVSTHLAQQAECFGKIMLDFASRTRSGRSHLRLHKDRDGYFVRCGRRGSCKQYLGRCKVTYLGGEPSLFAYTLADHDAFEAEQPASLGCEVRDHHVMTIEQLPYAYGWSLTEEETYRIRVKLDNVVVFEKTVESIRDVQPTIDEYVRSQGWMTFGEWNQKFPLRYKLWVDEDERAYDSTFCDQVCTDRLTGKEVFRYDLGDPANTNSHYGGVSNSDRFLSRKLNERERVRVEDCVVKD